MHNILASFNHKSTPLDVREQLFIAPEHLPNILQQLSALESINECVILSTCNRVEVYAVSEHPYQAMNDIISFLSELFPFSREKLLSHLFRCQHYEVIEHLFGVAAGLDSIIIGEEQILSQIKTAYQTAFNTRTTKSYLNKLFQTAIRAGKKIRSEIPISQGSVSYGSITVEIANKMFSNSREHKILLIGAGEIAEVTAKNIRKHIRCKLCIANRTQHRAEELAKKYGGYAIPFADRYKESVDSDIVICSTQASSPILTANEMPQSKLKKQLLIDLSVPRNIDSKIVSGTQQRLITVDDFSRLVEQNMKKRSHLFPKAKQLLNELGEEYTAWYIKQNLLPTIRELWSYTEEIAEGLILQEADKFSEKQQKILASMFHTFTEKTQRKLLKDSDITK